MWIETVIGKETESNGFTITRHGVHLETSNTLRYNTQTPFGATQQVHHLSLLHNSQPRKPLTLSQRASPWMLQNVRLLSNINSNNPYEVLGVSRSATPVEIKRKYYDLAKRYHPDSSHEDSNRTHFVKISSAYELLSDPQRRARYDATGVHEDFQATEAHAEDVFTHVWQEFGIKEYMDAMQEDGATALHAARHGDYSLLWEFAKERRVLILSALLPLAAMVRFPGMFSFVLRLGVVFTVSVLQQMPPQVAYSIFRRLIFRK